MQAPELPQPAFLGNRNVLVLVISDFAFLQSKLLLYQEEKGLIFHFHSVGCRQ